MFNLFKKKASPFFVIREMIKEHLRQLEDKKDLIPKDVFDVTKFSLEDILSVFESMDILIAKNDFKGCLKISRTILENSVNIRYVYKEDIEKRAKNFKLQTVKNLSDKFESLDEKEVLPHAKELHAVFTDMLKGYVKEKNMREKFVAINSDHMYVRSYKRLSEYVHPMYRDGKIDFDEDRPYAVEMKRTVMTDTSLVTLIALKAVCEQYNLEGGVMVLDDPGYIGLVAFATNPKRAEDLEMRVNKKTG